MMTTDMIMWWVIVVVAWGSMVWLMMDWKDGLLRRVNRLRECVDKLHGRLDGWESVLEGMRDKAQLLDTLGRLAYKCDCCGKSKLVTEGASERIVVGRRQSKWWGMFPGMLRGVYDIVHTYCPDCAKGLRDELCGKEVTSMTKRPTGNKPKKGKPPRKGKPMMKETKRVP